jgi:metal transporter CNNM
VQDTVIWVLIAFCVTQSAMFSGLNLAFFSLSRLRLETEANHGNSAAKRILDLRRDSNFLLTTILWGNVGINVLLTLLSNSALAGVAAFLFSTVIITLFGEIMPQAYFSRHAMKMATLLAPVLRFYQWLLYPVAKPCARMLDKWLGKEMIEYLQERDLKRIIAAHIGADEAEVEHIEGIGALNFLEIDDLTIAEEGEVVDPASIIRLPLTIDLPIIPKVTSPKTDTFVAEVQSSGKKWVIFVDDNDEPKLVLDADGYLRAIFQEKPDFDPYTYCHRPIILKDPKTTLDVVIKKMKQSQPRVTDEAIQKDMVLLWGRARRVVTGADILGRLLDGITTPLQAAG